MKLMIHFLVFIMIANSVLFAATITDISPKDGNYKAIKKSVDKGYFSLYDGSYFKPNATISRKELAIILDKWHGNVLFQKKQLSSTHIDELVHLSGSYKNFLSGFESDIISLKNTFLKLENEQKSLIIEQSQFTDTLQTKIESLEAQLSQQHLYYIVGGIGLAGIVLLIR